MLLIPRILVVDDNPDHRLILTYQLGKIGTFDIREAVDGRQVLMVLAAVAPDLIFMNLSATSALWQLRWDRFLSSPLRPMPVVRKNTTHAKQGVMPIWSSLCLIGVGCNK
jgi:CheY-like chemotaxis protein